MYEVRSVNSSTGRFETRSYTWCGDARAQAKYLRDWAKHQYVELWDVEADTSIDIDCACAI